MPTVAGSVIAIDGPAASGKSSVARRLAHELDFAYVNSGSAYRAVAWLALWRGGAPGGPPPPAAGGARADAPALAALLARTDFRLGLRDKVSYILVDGVDPEAHLRSVEVNRVVSEVSALRPVRDFLLEPLRSYARDGDLIMEGRDIGSTVFPHTPYKFYIDASPGVRARRRAAEGLRDDLVVRDRLDSSRVSSPLTVAPDALVVDTSALDLEGVVRLVLARLRERGLPSREHPRS